MESLTKSIINFSYFIFLNLPLTEPLDHVVLCANNIKIIEEFGANIFDYRYGDFGVSFVIPPLNYIILQLQTSIN